MARKPVIDMSAWPSVSLEGNLIAPAMVAQIAAPGKAEDTRAGYRVRKGLTIREEISTAFRVGQSHFDAFARLDSPSAEATRRFIKAFLAETFGFDDLAVGNGVTAFIAGDRVPVVVVPPSDEKLDRRSPTLSVDRSRSPAFALQDYLNEALLHKSFDGRGSPFPGQTHPTTSVTGMPSAVKPFRTATRTWNSAT